MGKLIFILGGARSGKSNFAEKLLKNNKKKIYLASAIASDNDMAYRIKRHQQTRDENWITIERYDNFQKLNENKDFKSVNYILLDCLTLMVNNQMLDFNVNWDKIQPEEMVKIEEKINLSLKTLLDLCNNKNLYIVSNEVGMGIVPDNMFAIYFRDILGRLNQLIAQKADQVFFMIAGIPVILKGEGNESIYRMGIKA